MVAEAAPVPEGRLLSLDLFRGLTVAGMIFVNNPGDWGHVAWPFGHAEWHGATPTDLIFPFFLFIVGTSAVLSFEKRETQGADRAALLRHALVRGLTIAVVGWLMAAYPFTLERWQKLRVPGVLVRIGVVYALGALVLLALRKRKALGLVLVCAALLALHTALLLGTGYDLTRENNFQRAVDLAVLKGHLWKPDWDPEGIVSTLSALATLLTGALAGLLLTRSAARPLKTRIGLLAAWGAVATLAGLTLHPVLPLNKNLWTASYVLFTSGAAALGLALCLYVVDVKGIAKPFAFFVTFGRNPFLAFVLSGLLAKTMGLIKWAGESGKPISLSRRIFVSVFGPLPDPYLASHAYAAATLLFWWIVLRAFEKRGWYWKV